MLPLVVLSLREERRLQTSSSIAAAALELFAARGYAEVTVAEVATAAGVGERTLYRYFADKEDLLFGEDEAWRALLREAVDQQPDGPPLSVLRGASGTVARALEGRREEVARRGRVIAGSPALVARDRAKHAAWELVLAEGLARRGAPAQEAALLGRIGVACYDQALTRWLAQDRPSRTLAQELEATFDLLAGLVGPAPPAPSGGPGAG